jgi:hypothetical protein
MRGPVPLELPAVHLACGFITFDPIPLIQTKQAAFGEWALAVTKVATRKIFNKERFKCRLLALALLGLA